MLDTFGLRGYSQIGLASDQEQCMDAVLLCREPKKLRFRSL